MVKTVYWKGLWVERLHGNIAGVQVLTGGCYLAGVPRLVLGQYCSSQCVLCDAARI